MTGGRKRKQCPDRHRHTGGFPERGALGGVAFQRKLEEAAYQAAGGKIPVQLYGDFCQNKISSQLGGVNPQMRGEWAFGDVRSIMPEPLNQALIEAMEGFGHMIHGFDRRMHCLPESKAAPLRRCASGAMSSLKVKCGAVPLWGRCRLCRWNYLCGHGWHKGGRSHCKALCTMSGRSGINRKSLLACPADCIGNRFAVAAFR